MLCLVVLLISSCEDDEVTVYEPTELTILGPEEVSPGDTATYITDRYENETYSWTVPAGATVTSGEDTPVVTVTFTAAGGGEISVAARGINGTKAVDVLTSAPEASIALDSGVVLSEGETANVLISFDQDIASAPEVSMVEVDKLAGGTLGAVEKVDDRTFQVAYTAGTGDGIDQVSVVQAVSTEFYGSVTMDTVMTFDVYKVDNTSATGELMASQTPVSDDMAVTLSAVFSEALSTSDTVKVSVNGITTDAAYVTDANMITQDGITWTYVFEPEDGANELASVSINNLPADLAGNATEAVEPIIIQIKND
ncbi:hypothetical protein OKW21_005169 [Catalinimonas alkaloidigena]|uniref:hypothetical protein n=1 Tax=Catalinimonas alkaloidigena TaxID=1075417 RepID=UPI002405D127|nr:hypothetical protein [Catalinimonas alkaloidigena]MDF9799906.1 hypothetical protein [Catalinimonas alkaloidigena]